MQGVERLPFRKVLLGLDTSEQSLNVLHTAAELSRAFDAKLIVCTVVNIPTSVRGNELDGFPANDEERKILDKLDYLVHQELGSNETVDLKILHGDPAERIAEYAEYSNCDLIMVGSRGQGAIKKALLGSVSSSVASRSKKSVLIFR